MGGKLMQKRILCGLFACVLLLGGCSTNTNVHKKEPEKQKDTENNSEVNKTYEFTGVIKIGRASCRERV